MKSNAVPTLLLPVIIQVKPEQIGTKQEPRQDVLTQRVIELDEPIPLFVALFIDEAGKIVNFSLVQYGTVEKWTQMDNFEYTVAEIFTSTESSVDTKRGLLGPFFNCGSCQSMEKFGVVVMQKKLDFNIQEATDVIEDVSKSTEIIEQTSAEENNYDIFIDETPTEELEERLVGYTNYIAPQKSNYVQRISSPPQKKSRMLTIFNEDHDKLELETTVHGIQFFMKRSCNKCNFSSTDEQELQTHVQTCTENYLGKIGFNNFKGSQRIRNSYMCSRCHLSILKRDIEAHAEFHAKLAPYACSCSKCFLTKKELDEHSKVCGRHLFTCRVCHKEFVQKKELYQHKLDAHDIDTPGQILTRNTITVRSET